jgi:hypothetical protein
MSLLILCLLFLLFFVLKAILLVSAILSWWDSAIKHRPKYLGSTSLHIFHWGLCDNRSVSYDNLNIQSNRSEGLPSCYLQGSRDADLHLDPLRYKDFGIQRTMQHITKLHPQWGALPSILQPSWLRDAICFLTVRAVRWNLKHPILKNKHLVNLKHPQSSIEPLNRREPNDYRSFVNKICNHQGLPPVQW